MQTIHASVYKAPNGFSLNAKIFVLYVTFDIIKNIMLVLYNHKCLVLLIDISVGRNLCKSPVMTLCALMQNFSRKSQCS